jgi:hypothetical protein
MSPTRHFNFDLAADLSVDYQALSPAIPAKAGIQPVPSALDTGVRSG